MGRVHRMVGLRFEALLLVTCCFWHVVHHNVPGLGQSVSSHLFTASSDAVNCSMSEYNPTSYSDGKSSARTVNWISSPDGKLGYLVCQDGKLGIVVCWSDL